MTEKHSLALLSIFLVLDEDVGITTLSLHDKHNTQNQTVSLQFALLEQIINVKGWKLVLF